MKKGLICLVMIDRLFATFGPNINAAVGSSATTSSILSIHHKN